MESLLSLFLLFIAGITALLTYMYIPHVSIVALTSAAAIALAAGIWWHWTQFAVDYRTSTWQEQLRNYASYAMVLLVILLSYAFYVFAYSGSTLEQYAMNARTAVQDAGRKATSRLMSSATRTLSAASEALLSESPEDLEEEEEEESAGSLRGPSRNLLV